MGVNLMENLLHERAYDLDFFVQKKIEKNPLNQSVPELTEKFMNKTRQIERVSEEVTEEVIRREIDWLLEDYANEFDGRSETIGFARSEFPDTIAKASVRGRNIKK
jgi:hypothetical protein